MSDDVKPLDPEQAAALARIRRFMMIASVTTFIAIAVVFAPNVVFVLPSYVITMLWAIRARPALWPTYGVGLAFIGLLYVLAGLGY